MPGLGDSPDPMIGVLRAVIRVAVRVLAVLMTILIVLGVLEVGLVMVEKMLKASPMFVLSISDILATFGAFMAVLIAIEIFVNITLYLREDVIHVWRSRAEEGKTAETVEAVTLLIAAQDGASPSNRLPASRLIYPDNRSNHRIVVHRNKCS